jgi:hypothetical protein
VALRTSRRRRLAWIAVAVAVAVWPLAPLVVLGASVADAYAAVRPIEGIALGRVVRHPGSFSRVLRRAATDLARARLALGWLGNESGWPVVGPWDSMARNAVNGAYELALAATRVLGAASTVGAARDEAIAQAGVDALPTAVRGLDHLRRLPAWTPAPSRTAQMLRLASAWTPLVQAMARSRGALAAALGLRGPTRYLLLFQDSGELRATGGFLAAYGYVTVRGARVSVGYGGALTHLANQVTVQPSAGPVLQRYFHEQRLSLINANDHASGPVSAAALLQLYRSIPGAPPVAGIILVDSWWVDGLLKIAGAVPVFGTGQTLTAINAPLVLEQLAEHRRLPAGVGRMAFLGPILRTLADRLMPKGHPDPALLPALLAGLRSGGVLLEPANPDLAQLAARLGWSGALYAVGRHQNYLMVCNQNLGGLKDNLYLTEGISVSLRGRAEQIRLTLRLPHRVTKANGWLLGNYQGYVTLHLPSGTRLLHLAGAVGPATVAIRASKTVIGFGVSVEAAPAPPFAATTVTLLLALPPGVGAHAPLLFQNQPGLRPGAETLRVSTPSGRIVLAPAGSVWVEPAPHDGLTARAVQGLP